MIRLLAPAVLVAALALPAMPQAKPATAEAAVCATCIEAHVRHLASAELNGRRCATGDEARAADDLIGELKRVGVAGGLPGGGYLQAVPLDAASYAVPPTLAIGPAAPLSFGRDFWGSGLQQLDGPFVRVTDATAAAATLKGAVVFYDADGSTRADAADPAAMAAFRKAGAKAVIVVASPLVLQHWGQIVAQRAGASFRGEPPRPRRGPITLMIRPEAAAALRAAPSGESARLAVAFGPPTEIATHNVVGVIHGSAPDADHRAVLLSAHYDHLGMRDGRLYPGANDDASGTAAVLEFARVLKAGAPPKRTVYFALFGCEEEGGFGATFFDRNPPLPIADLAANIEFEMIGFRDPQHPDKLMMTGYERSNLGPELAAHGAQIEQDPYPEQGFFQRSDNYALARVGVVAHTISAWPTPPTYHQPTDTAGSVDYAFMAGAIASLVGPIRWLLDSDFAPAWSPGGKP